MSNAPQRALRPLPGHAALRQTPKHDRELVAVVRAAGTGEHSAWTDLVHRFDATLRAIARSYRLAPTDVDDVVQTIWLDLLEHIGQIRAPGAIGGWLATATRRKSLRIRQVAVRERLTDESSLGDRPDADGPEARLLATERRAVLDRAFASLPDRHRRLMTVLLTRPELDYGQVSELLSMPRGSIGPIRARSLARLSREPQLRALRDDATTH
jgi:RNA polymerase sigma factor (sigma-70 family)